DHLIRTKPLPMWIDRPAYDDDGRLREQIAAALAGYASRYAEYIARNRESMPAGMAPFDPLPRVILMPGLGAVCAGPTLEAARTARDITVHTLAVKARIASMGGYKGLPEDQIFHMEYRRQQHDKLARAFRESRGGERGPFASDP